MAASRCRDGVWRCGSTNKVAATSRLANLYRRSKFDYARVGWYDAPCRLSAHRRADKGGGGGGGHGNGGRRRRRRQRARLAPHGHCVPSLATTRATLETLYDGADRAKLSCERGDGGTLTLSDAAAGGRLCGPLVAECHNRRTRRTGPLASRSKAKRRRMGRRAYPALPQPPRQGRLVVRAVLGAGDHCARRRGRGDGALVSAARARGPCTICSSTFRVSRWRTRCSGGSVSSGPRASSTACD